MSPRPNEYLASLLGEVKFAEKQAAKLESRVGAMETLIRDALRAGKRDVAKEHALRFEELKRQIEAAKQRVAAAKQAYEAGKRKTSELESAQQQAKLTAPLAAMADQAGVLTAADDMLRKLEQEAALDEARIELAMGELPPELPSSSPEDILKEFE